MKGYSLIELMICVAIIGILAAAAGVIGGRYRLVGMAETQREHAEFLLLHHADHLARGSTPDAVATARLEERLPDARLTATPDGDTVTLSVHWRDPMSRPASASLTVFRGRP